MQCTEALYSVKVVCIEGRVLGCVNLKGVYGQHSQGVLWGGGEGGQCGLNHGLCKAESLKPRNEVQCSLVL